MNEREALRTTAWILASATGKMELLFAETRCAKEGINLGV